MVENLNVASSVAHGALFVLLMDLGLTLSWGGRHIGKIVLWDKWKVPIYSSSKHPSLTQLGQARWCAGGQHCQMQCMSSEAHRVLGEANRQTEITPCGQSSESVLGSSRH